MKNLGLQIYTCRDFMHTEADVKDTFERVAKAGYTQIQTAGCDIPYEKYAEYAHAAGLEIVGTHDNFDRMVNDFEGIKKDHDALGTKIMGIGGRQYASFEELLDFIEKANVVAKKCKEAGFKFTYHNHAHEFYRWPNGKTTMDMLFEGLDPDTTSFVLDTYWVQTGGGDVVSWIEKLSGRIDILHLKDMRIDKPGFGSSQKMAEIGNGNLDWPKIIEAAKKAGVKYYVVEQDRDFQYNCFDSVKQSADFLKQFDI